MRINNNIAAVNSHRQYGINNTNVGKSVEKLSSGYRINRAGDDAAGLAISEKMRAQVRGLNMASKNSQDAISLIQTAEGALQTTHDILQRMRELAVQSSSDTNQNSVDREALQEEFSQLRSEINDTADKTKFNGQALIDGSFQDKQMQIGANEGDTMSISISEMSAAGLGIEASSVSSQSAASTAIAELDAAINSVSTQRSKLGALQNRLEFKIQNLEISSENLNAAESRIRDVDMAKQMTQFSKSNILFQASTAMLAQANSLPQGVLQLLG